MLNLWFLLHVFIIVVTLFLIVREVTTSKVWLAIFSGIWILHLFNSWYGTGSLIFFGIVILISIFLTLIKPLRAKLFSQFGFNYMKKSMPPMSATEKEAINAGTVWWESQLFSGKPNWQQLFETKTPELTPEESSFLENETEKLCSLLDEWKINNIEKDLSVETWEYIKNNKFLGMMIPQEYGGLGFSEHAHAAVITKVATASSTAAVTVMVPNSLGPAKLLLNYGTQAQKDQYLTNLATGKEIPCFALTAPNAGSDAAAIPDTGVVCLGDWQGESTLGIRINWDKRFITLAPIATLLGLAFYVIDPDKLLGEDLELGLTCALIPTDLEGVIIGNRHNPVDTPFFNGPTQGKDVFIPLDFIIGGQDNIGIGWKMLMESLAVGRGISLPALGNATGQFAIKATTAYSIVRSQFNLPIGKFGGVGEKLTEIAGLSYACDSVSKLITSSLEIGEKPAVLSAMAKYFNTESARKISNHGQDIHAGKGIMLGKKNYLYNRVKPMPVAITVEGANILTRSLMIFGQGAFRCHLHLPQIIGTLETNNLAEFDSNLFKYIGHMVKNKIRIILYGLSNGYCSSVYKADKLSMKYQRKINVLSAAYSDVADTSLVFLGGQIKRQEILTGHLVDAWMSLVVASAVLKKYHSDGEQDLDKPVVEWILQDQLNKSYIGLESAISDLPYKVLSKSLPYMLLAISRPRPPAAKLTQQVSDMLLENDKLTDRLSEWCYKPSETDPVYELYSTVEQSRILYELEAKAKQAKASKNANESQTDYLARLLKLKIIDEPELKAWVKAQTAKVSVCEVDDFTKEEFNEN